MSYNRRDFLKQTGLAGITAPFLARMAGNRESKELSGYYGAVTQKYYVDSETGNDNNSGNSPGQAWKTLEKVNKKIFKPGDQILFKTATHYKGRLKLNGSGNNHAPIVVGMYGEGPKPIIHGQGRELEAVLLHNEHYWEIRDLEVTNTGPIRKPNRVGVHVVVENFGTARHIHLKNLTVREVNGSLVKDTGGGAGIRCENRGFQKKTRFDGLRIEDCNVMRTDRDGITIYSDYTERDKWYPNYNVKISNNLLVDIGGDVIVPRGCDGTVIEHNKVDGGRTRCNDYAAGIWPWSCDNTTIQFNEVTGMSGTMDGMAFDSDWNCRNTLLQYNYSHGNPGGFLLIVSDGGKPGSVGNQNTVVRYNISQNDGHRILYITGPCNGIRIYNNTIYSGEHIDAKALYPGGGNNGYADDTLFANNIFYADGKVKWGYGGMSNLKFTHNVIYGNHEDAPDDPHAIWSEPGLVAPGTGRMHYGSLHGYKLKSESSCYKAGMPISDNGGRDIWEKSVPEGKPPTIGASAV